MGVTFPVVIENAREEALSGDLNRQQALASAALQNELQYESLDTAGVPINVFTKPSTTTGAIGAFTVALSAGEAMVNDSAGVGSDDSTYKPVQWIAQSVGPFANPDATNGRIDLICVTPATAQTDNSVRNVLLDPVARTFAPATVPKTARPLVVPFIVTGTAAASPLSPAVPSGSYALFEVFVEPSSADASQWPITPRMGKKAGYPFSGMPPTGQGFSGGVGVPIVYAPQCGIVRGCALVNANVLGVISSSLVPGVNTVVIDGEVIDFAGSVSASLDTISPPTGAAPTNNDVPYFLYLVGGRNLPSNNLTGAPVQMVASLTPPNIVTGRPTAAIGTARGNTSSALFVGVGFILKNASTYRGVQMVGDVAWAGSGGANFSQNQNVTAGPTLTLAAAPSIADSVVLNIAPTFPGGSNTQLQIGDYEKQYPDPGAFTLRENGTVRTRIAAGVCTFSVVGITNTLIETVAFRIPGIRRLA
jgi:hypothetical protein